MAHIQVVKASGVIVSEVAREKDVSQHLFAWREAARVTPATAFEGKTARGNLGWWWLRVRGRHGP